MSLDRRETRDPYVPVGHAVEAHVRVRAVECTRGVLGQNAVEQVRALEDPRTEPPRRGTLHAPVGIGQHGDEKWDDGFVPANLHDTPPDLRTDRVERAQPHRHAWVGKLLPQPVYGNLHEPSIVLGLQWPGSEHGGNGEMLRRQAKAPQHDTQGAICGAAEIVRTGRPPRVSS